jgi:hypothetical protein
MLADPEYNPADPRTAGGTFEPRYAAPPRRPAFPAPLNGRVRSYCRQHDIAASATTRRQQGYPSGHERPGALTADHGGAGSPTPDTRLQPGTVDSVLR